MNKFYSILNQLAIGDRVVVPKSSFNFIQHHAIYLGFYSGNHWFIENKENVGVRTVTADAFFSGVTQITRTERFKPRPNYSRIDLVQYAMSKLHTPYHLTNYNCESFANDVQYHRIESRQANVGVGLLAIAGIAFVIGQL